MEFGFPSNTTKNQESTLKYFLWKYTKIWSKKWPICSENNMTLTELTLNPFQPSAAFHIETSHLTGSANPLTGACMKRSTELKRVTARLEYTLKLHNLRLSRD